jgi:S2P endopeptidase
MKVGTLLLQQCMSPLTYDILHWLQLRVFPSHRIPMLAAGASITFMFPAAFVTLPSARVEELSSLDRLRVITSGCYHNLTLWLILLATAWSGIGRRVLLVGYEDVFVRGLIVTHVEPVSVVLRRCPHYPC